MWVARPDGFGDQGVRHADLGTPSVDDDAAEASVMVATLPQRQGTPFGRGANLRPLGGTQPCRLWSYQAPLASAVRLAGCDSSERDEAFDDVVTRSRRWGGKTRSTKWSTHFSVP